MATDPAEAGPRIRTSAAADREIARRDPERTRAAILQAAIEEFSARGLLGGRIDAIAERTSTTKRMIYYYFESKERLYQAALIESYRRIRDSEVQLHLDEKDPQLALRMLVRTTMDHHADNIPFLRLVNYENGLEAGAIHLMDDHVREANASTIRILEDILARGRAQGVFRADENAPSALDVHQVLSSIAFFRGANAGTFGELFGRQMLDPSLRDHITRLAEDTVLRLVQATPQP